MALQDRVKLRGAFDSLKRGFDTHGTMNRVDDSVVMWGEFGRTPRINNMNSRDRWPQANCAVMAGGGMRTGQVVGRTNRNGEHPIDRPVKFQEVFATLYKNAGIDVENVRVFDQAGTPQYLVEQDAKPMRELV